MRQIALGLTGATGLVYGFSLLDQLIQHNIRVHLVYSPAAQIVAKQELGFALSAQPARAKRDCLSYLQKSEYLDQLTVWAYQDWFSPLASGGHAVDTMVICPCTMGCVGAIAAGLADNLLERGADVMLKERKNLILAIRETPLSSIHLENMLRVSCCGAIVMPLMPGFYHQPQSLQDLVRFMVAKILGQMGIEHQLLPTWARHAQE